MHCTRYKRALAGITFTNFDYLTVIKLLLDENQVNYTITYSKKIVEYKSSLPIKVNDNTASIRNINYIRTPKTTQS